MATHAKVLQAAIRGEAKTNYAYRVMPDGELVRLTPFGAHYFGKAGLAYLKAKAKRGRWKLIVKGVNGPDAWRDLGVVAMRWALAHEPAIHYEQLRPFDPAAILRRHLPIRTDCSGSSTMLHRAAGCPDPNGRRYDGQGFTGTIRETLPQIRLSDAKPLDLIVYGPGTGLHVVAVFEPGHDPKCFSHGGESGPKLYRHSQEDAVHAGGYTVHRALHPAGALA